MQYSQSIKLNTIIIKIHGQIKVPPNENMFDILADVNSCVLVVFGNIRT